MLSKREVHVVSLHEIQLGHSVAEAARNIINEWNEGTASECTTRKLFKKHVTVDMSLQDREGRDRLSEVYKNELNAVVDANQIRRIAKELNVDHVGKNGR